MEKLTAEYWIKHLQLVEHPGEEDGYFSVPFEDSFKVTNAHKVESLYKLLLQVISLFPKYIQCSFVGQEQRSAASIAHFLQEKADRVNAKVRMARSLINV